MTDSIIQAVIFDMDGVLIDAKDWHYEALNQALRLFGMEITRYDHLVTYDGLPTRKKLEMLSQERGLPRQLHTFINDLKQRYTMEIVCSRCHPVFHHQYALAKLKHAGFRLAVASNSIRNTVEVMMERADLNPFLEFFLSNQDVTHAKPHPEIYEKAVSRLSLSPKQCLIVEDNPHGIEAAHASGAHVLEVASPNEVTWDRISSRIEQIKQTQPEEVLV